ncbi:hypothetical protein PAPHI01_0405 [Pancytospora philotis]|nr:hypothetical protein PAPHI01_0405 [Pancytospora philotis]
MFARELAQMNERISARRPDELRAIAVEHFPGLVYVRSAKAAIAVTYSSGTTAPYPDRPGEGIFQIALAGKKNDLLVGFLQSVYIKSKCVTLDVLKYACAVEAVSIEIKVMEVDGNLYSMCIAGINAVIAALSLKRLFLPSVFSFCSIDGRLLCDPDALELEASDWKSYVVMKSTREALLVELEGSSCPPQDVADIIDRAYDGMKLLAGAAL